MFWTVNWNIVYSIWFVLEECLLCGVVCLAPLSHEHGSGMAEAQVQFVQMTTFGAFLTFPLQTKTKWILVMLCYISLFVCCDSVRSIEYHMNPLSSMAWLMPPIQRFLRTYSPHIIHLDYCQFGEPWRKPTQLLFNYLDLSSVALQCQPFHSNCSHSKRPHLRLAGRDEKGVFWTLRAQPYPTELTDKIAALVAQVLKG